MADTLESVLIGGIAGTISAIITYLSTRSRIHLELAAEYDKDLRKSRLDAYKALWEMLEPLARYGRSSPITPAVLRDISDRSRDWYFKTGGIYLTRASRGPYFAWKAVMQPVLDSEEPQAKPSQELASATIGPILEAASRLRTSLSDDIGTKERSLL